VRSAIREAYCRVRDGFSADRVVADPDLNAQFLKTCRELGLDEPPALLNKTLLNGRKAAFLTGLSRSQRTSFRNEDEYRFASEVAARYLQQRDEVSLDEIISDPSRASEFDRIAQDIAPGYSSLQYRWAALNLRKAKRLRPELLAQVQPPEAIDFGSLDELHIDGLPTCHGIYIFYGPDATLYIGETENLRKRVSKHIDHSDNKGLARWFWEHGYERVHLEIRVLPPRTSKRVRTALERELIESRRPLFNVQHT